MAHRSHSKGQNDIQQSVPTFVTKAVRESRYRSFEAVGAGSTVEPRRIEEGSLLGRIIILDE